MWKLPDILLWQILCIVVQMSYYCFSVLLYVLSITKPQGGLVTSTGVRCLVHLWLKYCNGMCHTCHMTSQLHKAMWYTEIPFGLCKEIVLFFCYQLPSFLGIKSWASFTSIIKIKCAAQFITIFLSIICWSVQK